MRKTVVHSEYLNTKAFVEALPEHFEQEGELIYDGRNTVKRFLVEGVTLIVKRYKRPTIFQKVTYAFFRPSKAVRAYLFASLLREREIATPHEVGYLEEYRGGLYQGGYFVSTECTDAEVEAYLEQTFDRELLSQLAAFLVELHQKGVLHGDLNLSNILFRKREAGGFLFTLIDTNRSVFKVPNREQALHNLIRVSHRIEVLQTVVSDYALLRGWDPQEVVRYVVTKRERFNKRLNLRRRFKKLLHLKK